MSRFRLSFVPVVAFAASAVLASGCTTATGLRLGGASTAPPPAPRAAEATDPAPAAAPPNPAPAAPTDPAPPDPATAGAPPAAAPPAAAPEVRFSPSGVPYLPGGRLRGLDRTCDAAHDHCLRPETWFVADAWDDHDRPDRATPAFAARHQWFEWKLRTDVTGVGYRTVPANPATLAPGAIAVVFPIDTAAMHEVAAGVPPNEFVAETTHWVIGVVDRMDRDPTFFHLRGDHRRRRVAAARVVVEQGAP